MPGLTNHESNKKKLVLYNKKKTGIREAGSDQKMPRFKAKNCDITYSSTRYAVM